MLTENYKDHWVAKFIDYDFPLTEKQYRIFCHGFNADWDHRYESISVDGWHYVYRSGVWLEKIRYVKQKDGMYHITEHYVKDTKESGPGQTWLEEVLFHGAWEEPLFTAEEIEIHLKNWEENKKAQPK